MLQPKLTSVRPERGHVLYLEYDSGEPRRFDVSPYMNGSWYGELCEPTYFNAVRLLPGGGGIEWPHGQDIAPHELYDLSEPVARDA